MIISFSNDSKPLQVKRIKRDDCKNRHLIVNLESVECISIDDSFDPHIITHILENRCHKADQAKIAFYVTVLTLGTQADDLYVFRNNKNAYTHIHICIHMTYIIFFIVIF